MIGVHDVSYSKWSAAVMSLHMLGVCDVIPYDLILWCHSRWSESMTRSPQMTSVCDVTCIIVDHRLVSACTEQWTANVGLFGQCWMNIGWISRWSECFELTNQLVGRLHNWFNIRHSWFWRINIAAASSLARLTLSPKSSLNSSFSPKYYFRSHWLDRSRERVKQRMTAGKLIADACSVLIFLTVINRGTSKYL